MFTYLFVIFSYFAFALFFFFGLSLRLSSISFLLYFLQISVSVIEFKKEKDILNNFYKLLRKNILVEIQLTEIDLLS